MAEKPVERPDFRDVQRQFALHMRSPSQNPAPEGLEDRRLAIYRRLIFNNIRTLLSKNFPVLKEVFGEQRWNQVIRDFIVRHRAKTPLFPEVAREFLQYLQANRDGVDQDLPFLLELAHYEWVELALLMDNNDPEQIECDRSGDLLTNIPLFSPVAWTLGYNWPVHQLRPDYLPKQQPEKPTWLMVYRNAHERISFMELTQATARLCQLLQDNQDNSGQSVLEQFAAEIGRPGSETVITGGYEQMLALQQKGIILGTQTVR